jgi:hypothetical protein
MRYLKGMKPAFLILSAVAAISLGGCADDLTPEVKDRPPAPYSPDPMSHIPQQADPNVPRI